MKLTTVLFRFEGRINRRDYWLKGILLASLITFGAGMLGGIALLLMNISTANEADPLQPELFNPLEFLVVILVGFLFTFMYLAVSAKRWHDIGKSSYWNILLFVPFLGALIIIPLTVVLGLLPGKKEDNKHGPTLRKP